MPYDRERLQVLNSIKRAGAGEKVSIEVTTGGSMGAPGATQQLFSAYFAQVNYTNRELSDPSLANGLMKIIIPAIDDAGVEHPNFKSVMQKSAKAVFANGDSISVKMVRITEPDHKTPVMARLFLGG